MEDAFRDQCEDDIALARWSGGDEPVKLESFHGAEDGADVAMGKGAFDGDERVRRHELFVSKQTSQALDLLRWPVRKIGKGAFSDLATLAE
jgi:hypothetical protein